MVLLDFFVFFFWVVVYVLGWYVDVNGLVFYSDVEVCSIRNWFE